MQRLLIGAAFVPLCLIGLVRLIRLRQTISERRRFADEFLDRLGRYVQSEGQDGEAYVWMTERSNKMQVDLGRGGVLAAYSPPFSNVQYTHYPVVLNMLPDLRYAFDNQRLSSNRMVRQYSMILSETLWRHLGTLDEATADAVREIRNPVVWFREGVRMILTIPIELLGWLGAVSQGTVVRLARSRPVTFLTTVVGIVSFSSAIMGIVVGWDDFGRIVLETWRRIF